MVVWRLPSLLSPSVWLSTLRLSSILLTFFPSSHVWFILIVYNILSKLKANNEIISMDLNLNDSKYFMCTKRFNGITPFFFRYHYRNQLSLSGFLHISVLRSVHWLLQVLVKRDERNYLQLLLSFVHFNFMHGKLHDLCKCFFKQKKEIEAYKKKWTIRLPRNSLSGNH